MIDQKLVPVLQDAVRAHARVVVNPGGDVDSAATLRDAIAQIQDVLETRQSRLNSDPMGDLVGALKVVEHVFGVKAETIVSRGAGRVQANVPALAEQLAASKQRLRAIIGDEPVQLGLPALREIYAGRYEGLAPEHAKTKLVDEWIVRLRQGLLAYGDFALPPSWGGVEQVAAARAEGVEKLARGLLASLTEDKEYAAGYIDPTELLALARPENLQAWSGLQGVLNELYLTAIARLVPQQEAMQGGRAQSIIDVLKPHVDVDREDVRAARLRSAELTMSQPLSSEHREATGLYLRGLAHLQIITRDRVDGAFTKWRLRSLP
jgi:hypothetical protein